MRLLLVWPRFTLTGGIAKFVRVQRALPSGSSLTFASLDGRLASPFPGLEVVPFEQVVDQEWDATMVPGAGGSVYPERCHEFAVIRAPNFGLRVQHVLGGPDRFDHFAAMVDHVVPGLVCFLDPRWTTELQQRLARGADTAIVIGGVNVRRFRPARPPGSRADPDCWVVGGSARKRPLPLLAACREAAARTGEPIRLELYGPVNQDARDELHRAAADGEVVLHGRVFDDELAEVYRRLDVFVDLQLTAGWRNPVAEAAASGVPCVTTVHGMAAINRHGGAVLTVDDAGHDVADALVRLMGDGALRRGLARRARAAVDVYSWEVYARTLLYVLRRAGRVRR